MVNGDEVSNSTIFFDPNKTELAEDEVLISIYTYISILNQGYNFNISKNGNTFIFNDKTYNSSDDLIKAVQDYYAENFSNYSDGLPIVFFNNSTEDSSLNYKVVGIYYPLLNDDSSDLAYYSFIVFKNSESAPNLVSREFKNYTKIITNLKSEKTANKDLIYYLSNYDSTEDTLVIRSEISDLYESYLSVLEILSNVFLWVSLGFAVFAILLLMNFITISISYKKKEIGILRALGARGTDVYGIFFNESLIITIINFITSVIVTILCVYAINSLILNELGLNITFLSFGLRQCLLIALIGIIVAAVATFLPTRKVSKMKPIDAILDRKIVK